MELLLVPLVALGASALTLFSGFGLGTILLPAFALFFPADLAVAMTAVVHLLNNLFKLALLGRRADRGVVLRFGIPAIVASFAGAAALVGLSSLAPVATWSWGPRSFAIEPINLAMAALMVAFALLEISPAADRLEFPTRWLPVGGLLSGFFGGLSGHQGALRAAFLVRAGLSKEAFLATGISVACLVDLTRLSVYAGHFSASGVRENLGLVAAATAAAFAGAFAGTRLMHKVTLRAVKRTVAAMLVLIAVLLAAGVV
ncbi:MAG TPA: TSUP family transporter [Candidatus Polarisedimenticolaceae bacterium]